MYEGLRSALDSMCQDEGTSAGASKGWETRRHNLKMGDKAVEARRFGALVANDPPIELRKERQNPVTIVGGKKNLRLRDSELGMFVDVPHYRVRYEDGVQGWVRPEALEEAQDSGTHEGAIKAAQTRKNHGGGGRFEPQPTKRDVTRLFPMEYVFQASKTAPDVAKKHLAEVLGQNLELARSFLYPPPERYQRLVNTPEKRSGLRALGYLS